MAAKLRLCKQTRERARIRIRIGPGVRSQRSRRMPLFLGKTIEW